MNAHPAWRTDTASVEVLLEQLADLLAARVTERLNTDTRPRVQDAASPWMSVDSAARYLDWPKQRLYKLTAEGAIPHYKHDGRLLFHRDELDTWLRGFAHRGGQ